jgi:AcrR family transcriptional regulator
MAVTKQKSASVSDVAKGNEKKDERIRRTRKQLDAAFVELLHRRSYGNIRVSDIVKKARVGRATFYAHYSSKDELLRSQFNRFVAPMIAIQQDPCPLNALAFLRHVQSAPHFFKSLVVGKAAGTGPRVLRDCFEIRVRQALEFQNAKSPTADATVSMHQAIVTRAVASSLLAVVACWMESGMLQPAEEVQTIFSKLVGGGLSALAERGAGNPTSLPA